VKEGEKMHNLSNNLKVFRIQNNMKQQDVADHLNITQEAYSHYEKGKREPNIDTLIKLAELFRVSVDVLIGRYVNVFDNNTDCKNLKAV